MKVMIDTNIFLDVLTDRKPFVTASSAILKACEAKTIEGYLTASCVTDLFYLLHRYTHNNTLTYKGLGYVFNIVKVCDVTSNHILQTYLQKGSDFEDFLVANCAISNNCACIVTRNKKDFVGTGIQALSPEELLQTLL